VTSDEDAPLSTILKRFQDDERKLYGAGGSACKKNKVESDVAQDAAMEDYAGDDEDEEISPEEQKEIAKRTRRIKNGNASREGAQRKKWNDRTKLGQFVGDNWVPLPQEGPKVKATKAENAAFKAFRKMATDVRAAKRKTLKEAFSDIRKWFCCALCKKHHETLICCEARLCKGKKRSKWTYRGIPKEQPILGEKCPLKNLDGNVERNRQFAEGHMGDWLLKETFKILVQKFRDLKLARMREASGYEDKSAYGRSDENGLLDLFVDVPNDRYQPHDGDADAILYGGTLASKTLTGLCQEYICVPCSEANGMKNNLIKGAPGFCFECYPREIARPAQEARKDEIRRKKSRHYMDDRAQRPVALKKPPRATTLITDWSKLNLWEGSEWEHALRLIEEPPIDQVTDLYNDNEIFALTVAVPNPFEFVSIELQPEYILAKDKTRPFDLPAEEFLHHFGKEAYELALESYDVQEVSRIFVLKGCKYEEAKYEDSDDSGKDAKKKSEYSEFSEEERDDNSDDSNNKSDGSDY
jgi:hypothetical protein